MKEMEALKKNITWDLVSLPNGKYLMDVNGFLLKYKSDGSNREAQRYAGWWGFTQTYGADCQETFSPVAKMNSFWVLISCAVNMRWILEHIDVTNAFLHWDLKEEVFMEIPPGFSNKIIEGKVCKLEMVLYGLK